jgi:hypothetical protein
VPARRSQSLGQYRSPLPGDRNGWIIEAFKREIRRAHGKPVESFAWEAYPAIGQVTMTTRNVFKPCRENESLHAFDFLAVGVLIGGFARLIGEESNKVGGRCNAECKGSRPACPLFDDLSTWRNQEWRCLSCGEPWDFAQRPRLKTYGELVRDTLGKAERKRLSASGEPFRRGMVMRGYSISRPVRVEEVTPMGKEVIVDPTDTDEGLTAEMLSMTEVLEYHNQRERLDALRAQMTASNESLATIARKGRIDRRTLQRFVYQGATLHCSTIEKLKTALKGR